MRERILHEQDTPGRAGAPPVARTEVIVACADLAPRWGGVFVGAVVGFGLMLVLGTLGSALGATAGTLAERKARKDSQSRSQPGAEDREGARTGDDLRNPTPEHREARKEAAKEIGIGGAICSVLTMIATGFLGGWASGRLVHTSTRTSWILGTATWSVGVIILLFLLAMGVSGLGAGMNQALGGTPGNVSSEDIETAGTITSAAIWALFLTELVGLAATILGARAGCAAHAKVDLAAAA